MIEVGFTPGELLRRTWRLTRAHLGPAVFAATMMTGLAVALDQNPESVIAIVPTFLLLFVSIYFQYELTRRALEGLDLLRGGYRTLRLGALLGLCLLTNVAIFVGLIFLIIPGLVLLVRWLFAVPILIVEEARIIESLQLSWEETRGKFWPLLTVILIIYGPPILINVAMFFIVDPDTVPSVEQSLIMNVPTYIAYVVGWYAAVAAYAMRRGGAAALADVFA